MSSEPVPSFARVLPSLAHRPRAPLPPRAASSPPVGCCAGSFKDFKEDAQTILNYFESNQCSASIVFDFLEERLYYKRTHAPDLSAWTNSIIKGVKAEGSNFAKYVTENPSARKIFKETFLPDIKSLRNKDLEPFICLAWGHYLIDIDKKEGPLVLEPANEMYLFPKGRRGRPAQKVRSWAGRRWLLTKADLTLFGPAASPAAFPRGSCAS